MITPLPDPTKRFTDQLPLVLLGCLVFGEARGESFQAKLAVASVVINRLEAHGYGPGLIGVCLKRYQFSCFNVNDPNRNQLLDPHAHAPEKVWEDCYYSGYLALPHYAVDPSQGAVFYHDVSLNMPPLDWGSVIQTAEIGRLRFYKPTHHDAQPA